MQDTRFQTPSAAPLLDQATAAFIQRSVAINVASRDAAMVPAVMRALGCKVALDRRRVTVFADERRASKLLTNIRTNGVIAVVFSQPSSHRTVQLKGSDAVVLEPVEDDPVIIAAYADSFVADLCSFGYSEAFARTLVTAASEKVVAITFTPEAAFDQTPGPHAGRSLGR